MKNYLVFGIVAIFTFVACYCFLPVTGLYKNAIDLRAQSSGSLINHLASSVTFASPVTVAEASSIIMPTRENQPALTAAIDSVSLVKSETIESAPVAYAAASYQENINHSSSKKLLTAPAVTMPADWENEDSATIEQQNLSSEQLAKSTTVAAAIITHKQEVGTEYTSRATLAAYANALAGFAKQYHYSEDYAFLINMGMKSGKKRFYVINLRTGEIMTRGLVAHGQGKKSFTLDKKYSNKPGSGCSSLGIYKVGGYYYGGYGKSFRLTGLEKTNSNAYQRAIVLHAMNCIPDEEINYPICQSEGCPSLSPNFLEELTPLIKASKKPILLWMFDPSIENNTPLQ